MSWYLWENSRFSDDISIYDGSSALKVFEWDYFLLLYFIMVKTKHAQHDSFYVEQVKANQFKFTRLKEVLENKGFIVQVQDRYPITVSIGQRGKKTTNKAAKKAGNMKHFSVNECYVYKWCLNRADHVKNTKALKNEYYIDGLPGAFSCRCLKIFS